MIALSGTDLSKCEIESLTGKFLFFVCIILSRSFESNLKCFSTFSRLIHS